MNGAPFRDHLMEGAGCAAILHSTVNGSPAEIYTVIATMIVSKKATKMTVKEQLFKFKMATK